MRTLLATSQDSYTAESPAPATDSGGIPASAIEFYQELERNNNRDWWLANKERYENHVKLPLAAALAPLEEQFGKAKLFRPYRDQRFMADSSPYKDSQGAFLSTYEEVGYHLHLDARGLSLGGGYRPAAPAQLARLRAAIDVPASGLALAEIVADLEQEGFAIHGTELKTVPSGFDKDHPRAMLLKFKSIQATVQLGKPRWLSTQACTANIKTALEQVSPLVSWVERYATP